jgi:hypothetical protein
MALICGIAVPAVADSFDTPEHAIKTFEDAYVRGDTTVALGAWDFKEAARLTQRMILIAPPAFFDGAFGAKQRRGLESSLQESLLKEMHDGVVARFAVSKCELLQKETLSPALVRLTQRCTVDNGKAYSQKLIAIRRSAGWRIAQYPSVRFYDPVCFSDAPSGILVCSERDGQHINATKGGRELWRKDSVRDWHIHPYRTIYPVIVSILKSSEIAVDEDLGPGTVVMVRYNSSEFGKCAVKTGAFRFLGQN